MKALVWALSMIILCIPWLLFQILETVFHYLETWIMRLWTFLKDWSRSKIDCDVYLN